GERVDPEQVLRDVQRRDEFDSKRQHAPLTAAPDAILVDTTSMSVDEVLDRVELLINHWRKLRSDSQRAKSQRQKPSRSAAHARRRNVRTA
ncbi:MAG: (d)CMP kinase, partial [Nitrospira sp.]